MFFEKYLKFSNIYVEEKIYEYISGDDYTTQSSMSLDPRYKFTHFR